MATLLDIKHYVANQLGVDTGATPTTIRDRFINQARRKFYSERRWSFLAKRVTPSWASGVASLPTDYNNKYDPIAVWSETGNLKIEYRKVGLSDLNNYPLDYVYAIDLQNSQIKINQTSATPFLQYTYLPADASLSGSDDNTTEPVQDITAIAYLAISTYWLASERSNARYQLFRDLYDAELAALSRIDAQKTPVLPLSTLPAGLGYTRSGRSDINSYLPRR